MQLGALTALAVTLSGCDQAGDDDCDRPPSTPRPRSLALAAYTPTVVGPGPTGAAGPAATPAAGPAATGAAGAAGSGTADVLPEQGGFGTHLASCGG